MQCKQFSKGNVCDKPILNMREGILMSEETAEMQNRLMMDIMSGMTHAFDAFYYCDVEEDIYNRVEGNSGQSTTDVLPVKKAYGHICDFADQVVLPEYREMFKKVMAKEYVLEELADKNSFEFEYEQDYDGKSRWKRGDAVAIERFEDGSVHKFCVFITDINALKLDEFEEMKKSRLQSTLVNIAMESSNIYEFIYYIPERTIEISESACKIYGCAQRYENMPESFRNAFVSPEFYDAYDALYDRCNRGEKTSIGEFMDIRRNGWYRTRLEIAQYDKDGAPLLAVGLVERIDELHQAQDRASTMLDACRFAVETHYEAFLLVDIAKDSYTFINFEGQENFNWNGYPEKGHYDETMASIIEKLAARDEDADAMASMLLANLVPYLKEHGQKSLRHRLKTGNEFRWKLVECTFFKHNQNKIIILITDIQKEEEGKEKLKSAMIAARDANKAKSAFLANMSHEIRTPMNTIIGLSEILMNKDLPGDLNNSITMIQNAGSGLLAIINDILDFSKMESGKFEINPVRYMLPSLLMDINNMITVRLLDKPIYFLINVDHNLPNSLVGDDIRIKQVLMNLLGNSVKFTKEGFIELHVAGKQVDKDNWRLVFQVIDSGIGIKKEDFSKLFGTFSQVDTTKNRAVTGSGLGLAISKSIAELMGGKIEVESEYGRGTTFTVEVLQKVEYYKPIGLIQKKERIRMLVCESEDIVLDSICRTLENLEVEYQVCREFDKVRSYEGMTHVMIRRNRFFEIKEKLNFMFDAENIYLILRNGEHASSDFMQYKQLQLPLLCMQVINAINGESIASSYKRKSFDRSQIVPLTFARVLIVDDNVTNLQVARGLMSPYQMKIDLATSGFKAIDMVKNERYDLVFMDHMMPEMDGIETARHIREIKGDYYKNLPIVALTANAMSDAKDAFMENGMDDFIAKPIEMTELNRVLKEYVQSKAPEGYLEKHEALQGTKSKGTHQPKTGTRPAPLVNFKMADLSGDGSAMGQLLIQNNTLLSQNMLLLQKIFGEAEGEADTEPVPSNMPVAAEENWDEEVFVPVEEPSESLYEAIPDVNMEGAVELYGGSVPMYHSILKTYYGDIAQRAPELEKLYEARDVKNFTIYVHAIKSASREVGADALGEMAFQLEKDGKAGDWIAIDEHYGPFTEALQKMIRNTGHYVKTYLEEDAPVQDGESLDGFSQEDVEHLKEACDEMDYLQAEMVLQSMRQHRYPGNVEKTLDAMIRYCEDYEYEKLEHLIGELK